VADDASFDSERRITLEEDGIGDDSGEPRPQVGIRDKAGAAVPFPVEARQSPAVAAKRDASSADERSLNGDVVVNRDGPVAIENAERVLGGRTQRRILQVGVDVLGGVLKAVVVEAVLRPVGVVDGRASGRAGDAIPTDAGVGIVMLIAAAGGGSETDCPGEWVRV